MVSVGWNCRGPPISRQKQGHSAQLLIVLGKLTAKQGDKRAAITDLEEAGQLAVRVRFNRMEADAMFELAKLYRDLGDIETADARATHGLAASQRFSRSGRQTFGVFTRRISCGDDPLCGSQ